MIQNLLPGIQHLQNIHPLVVHFPIAFLSGSALFYLLALLTQEGDHGNTAFSLLIVGTLGAAAAVGTGIYAEPSVILAPSVRGHLLEKHEDLMILTLCVSAGSGSLGNHRKTIPAKGPGTIRSPAICAPRSHVRGADYGARMVYDYNAGGNACPQPIEFVK